MEEGVEEVYGEEPEVREPLQEPLNAGISDLRDLTGVQSLTEADVHVVFMQPSVRPEGKENVLYYYHVTKNLRNKVE